MDQFGPMKFKVKIFYLFCFSKVNVMKIGVLEFVLVFPRLVLLVYPRRAIKRRTMILAILLVLI